MGFYRSAEGELGFVSFSFSRERYFGGGKGSPAGAPGGCKGKRGERFFFFF